MDFMTRLGLMVGREATEQANRRLRTRLKKTRLRQQACFEDMRSMSVPMVGEKDTE